MSVSVIFGDYQPSKVFTNEVFTACIQFYRSKEQAAGKYGNKDLTYKGEFGFDKFDKKVCAEGLVSEYETLDGIIPNDEVITGVKKYVCPYLTIWPPHVEGNLDTKKSKITVYVKAEKGTIELAKSSDIEFTSSNKNISILGSKVVPLTIDGEAQPLTLECKGPFEKDVTIEARAKGEFEILGKLIIKANAIRYKTIIQPVELIFGATENLTNHEAPHTSFIQNLVDEFNNNSFNQAYIYGELAPKTKIITLQKSEFEKEGLLSTKEDGKLYLKKDSESDDSTKQYNDKVENRFAASLTNQTGKQNAKEKLQNTIKEVLNQLDKMYSFKTDGDLKYTLKQYQNKIITTAWNSPNVQKAYQDYLVAKANYTNFGGDEITLNKDKKLHFFYTTDIYAAKNPNEKVLAYSELSSGVAHIFESAITSPDAYTTILHELGHCLGLHHSFDPELGTYAIKEPNKRYKDDVQKEIDNLESDTGEIKQLELQKKKLEEASKIAFKENLNQNEVTLLEELKNRYKYIENAVKTKNIEIMNFENVFLNMCIFSSNGKKGTIEIESNSLNITSEKVNLNTKELEVKIKEAKEKLEKLKLEKKNTEETKTLNKSKNQSKTQENFMDYYQDSSKNTNPDFERKSYYQWQWNEMQRTGIQNKFLEEIE